MNYEVKFESPEQVRITDGTVTFHISKVYIDKVGEKSKLVTITINNANSNYNSVDLYIPHIFPSGHRIDLIGENFIGEPTIFRIFNKIVISKGITVEASAFEMVKADEVVWPDDCPVIPYGCFFLSHIKKISNIDNVTRVGDYAFARTTLREIKWPTSCNHIPSHCFSDSNIKKIDNINHVKRIDKAAFNCCTALKRISWPKECPIIPKFCFADSGLETIEGIEAIEDIEESAFCSTYISMLDLSKAKIPYLKQGSLYGIPDSCEVTAPYYTSFEELQVARKNKYEHEL